MVAACVCDPMPRTGVCFDGPGLVIRRRFTFEGLTVCIVGWARPVPYEFLEGFLLRRGVPLMLDRLSAWLTAVAFEPVRRALGADEFFAKMTLA